MSGRTCLCSEGLCSGTGEPWQLGSSWAAKTSLVCTLGILVAVGNGLVFVVIASSVSGWSHSSRLVLLSLAAADTALALLVVPLNLYHSLALGPVAEKSAEAGDTSYCRAVAFINSSIFGASLYSLAGVSLERYVAVFFPLHYRRLLSRRRVALFITAAWLLPVFLLVPLSVPGPGAVLQVRFSAAALLCEPDYSSNTTYSVLMAGTIFCPAAGTVTFTNVRLWLVARSQRRRRKALAFPEKEVVRLKRLHLLPLDAASRILLPVVIAFYVCWAPCMGTILYNAITHERVHEWVEFVALWLPTGSGFLNCFVYFWINRSFRHKFQKVGHKLCCRAQQERHRHLLPTLSVSVGEVCKRPGSSCSMSSSYSLVFSQRAQSLL
ncbi:melatonin receptor type 1B-B-like [Tiliqua scincoides]|uniref:melatonin receptor type 1B-B-like n=1 Tax=Tiliqua scincoides TaxID=71010 RepID=UPI003462C152